MRPRLHALYDRFDPAAPATAQQRVARHHTPLDELVRRFRRSPGEPRVLLAGTTGTGKTTELIGFAAEMSADRPVVFVDLVRVYDRIGDADALQRVHPWEVVFQIGVAAALGLPPAEREARAQALLDAFAALVRPAAPASAPPTLDAGALIDAATDLFDGLPGAGVVKGAAKAVKWTLPLGTGDAVPDQDLRVRAMLDAANGALGALQWEARAVLVVDGLDRVADRERALELFVHSSLFGRLAVPIVVTAPFVLRHDPAFAQVIGFRPQVLLNEPVLDHTDRSLPGPGVTFFRDLYARRAEGLGDVLHDEDLVRLAMASGGRARDFVKLVRDAIDEAVMDGQDTIGPKHAARACEAHRRLVEIGLHDGHRGVLLQVMHTLRLPDSPLVQELSTWQRILPFPNESEWFYPHPLLIPMLTRSGSNGSSPG